MKRLLLLMICVLLLVTGCTGNSDNDNAADKSDPAGETEDMGESDVMMSEIRMIINDSVCTVKLENNATAEGFVKKLPQQLYMNELNGNEKYVYLDYSLPTDSHNPGTINKGDVMLFGDNCLVVFYESFSTPYSYTRIGHIDDLPDLGRGNVTVTFEQ